jgi:hypothetical protein
VLLRLRKTPAHSQHIQRLNARSRVNTPQAAPTPHPCERSVHDTRCSVHNMRIVNRGGAISKCRCRCRYKHDQGRAAWDVPPQDAPPPMTQRTTSWLCSNDLGQEITEVHIQRICLTDIKQGQSPEPRARQSAGEIQNTGTMAPKYKHITAPPNHGPRPGQCPKFR